MRPLWSSSTDCGPACIMRNQPCKIRRSSARELTEQGGYRITFWRGVVHWCGQHRGIIQLLQCLRSTNSCGSRETTTEVSPLRLPKATISPSTRRSARSSSTTTVASSGNKDSLGREKPFFNICKFRVNVATRATDLDTKDVQIEST